MSKQNSNPYEPPSASGKGQAGPWYVQALSVFSGLGILFGVCAALFGFAAILDGPSDDVEWFKFAASWAVIGMVQVFGSVAVLAGLRNLSKRQSWSTAMLCTIVALIPVLSPLLILGIPLAFATVFHLRSPTIRKSFNSA